MTTRPQGRERSLEKTEAILAGAMQEFLRQGYIATTMDRVAVAANVSKATVYSHFQDKEALFKAITQKLAQSKCMAIFILDQEPGMEAEPAEVLRLVASKMLNSTTQDQQFLAFVRLVIGESGRFPELAQMFLQSFDQAGKAILLQYLAAHPELNLPDPEAATYLFIGSLVHFLIQQEIMHGKAILPMDQQRFIASLVDLMTMRKPAS